MNNKDVYLVLEEMTKKEIIDLAQPSTGSIFSKKLFAWLKEHLPDIMVVTGYFLSFYFLVFHISRIYWSIYYLDVSHLPDMLIRVVYGVIIPCVTWSASTCFDFWCYKVRKLSGLFLAALNIFLILESMILEGTIFLLLPLLFKIPIGPDITERMIVMLSRGVYVIIMALVGVAFFYLYIKNIFSKSTITMIMWFRLNRNWDTRKYKSFRYDLKIVRRLSNGKMQRVFEEDRFLHSMFIGTTGTGKTSTCMTVAINNDLDKRIENEDYQKRKLSKLLMKKKIRMTRDFDDSEFSAYYFESTEKKYEKKLRKIQEKAMPVGITAMAPNEKFSDELYALAKAKSIKANRVDPNLDSNGNNKEGFIGFNPLYISPSIKGIYRKLEIFTKARVFADVNQAIFEKDENGDIYFTGLNRNLTTAITVMVLLTYPSLNNGKQPTPDVVQDIINDFDKAKKYRDELVKRYATKFTAQGTPVMDYGKAEVGEYQFILDVIDKDILGYGRKEMENQARGLRNIINETLANPLIRKVLCSENTIDIDECLDKGEVTFINYAINLGSAGIAFGMFYLLSYINAVLRRPAGKKLLPQFCYIDELPELLHPELGRTFALFRQYKVGMNVALQSIDQLDKSPKTKYLKNVIIGGCAHQIVFGRCSVAEMQMYQELSGVREEIVETIGVTETSLTMENTSKSMMQRETTEKVNNIEGGDMRYRDFREVTMFTVTKGSPVVPFYGKTFFLEDIKRIERRRYVFNWSKYFVPIEGFKEDTATINEHSSIDSKNILSDYKRSIANNVVKEVSQVETTQQSVNIIEENKEMIGGVDDNIVISAGSCEPDESRVEAKDKVEQDEIDIIRVNHDDDPFGYFFVSKEDK